jgi:hypothetical protein
VHPFEASVWAQPRPCAQTDVSPCDPAVHLRPEGGCLSRGGQPSDLLSTTSWAPRFSFLAMVIA